MSIKTIPTTRSNQPKGYTLVSPQEFLGLAKRNPGHAHALTAHGFRMVLGSEHSLTQVLAAVDDHGNVDAEAAMGADDILLAALMALAAALLIEAVKGDPPSGTTVIVSGDGNEVTVQSSGGGDANPDDGSHGGDAGGDGGGNAGGGGDTGGGDSSGGGANPGGAGG